MRVYNFSKLNNREKLVYSVSDIKLSASGIPVALIQMAALFIAVSLVFNAAIGSLIESNYWYPVTDDGINTMGVNLILTLPITLAFGAYYIKLQQYRLYQIILLLLRPKKPITISGHAIKNYPVSYDAFIWKERK